MEMEMLIAMLEDDARVSRRLHMNLKIRTVSSIHNMVASPDSDGYKSVKEFLELSDRCKLEMTMGRTPSCIIPG